MLDPDWKTLQFVRRVLQTFASLITSPCASLTYLAQQQLLVSRSIAGALSPQEWCGVTWNTGGSSAPRFPIRVVHAGEALVEVRERPASRPTAQPSAPHALDRDEPAHIHAGSAEAGFIRL